MALVSALPSGRGGVPTVMNTIFEVLTAAGRSVVNVSRPSLTLRATISGRPGSKNGSSPALSFSIFTASESTQMTLLPKSARQAPETRPTYPVPTTVSVYKGLSFRVWGGAVACAGVLRREVSRRKQPLRLGSHTPSVKLEARSNAAGVATDSCPPCKVRYSSPARLSYPRSEERRVG